MNELVKVNYDSDTPTVSARDLHEFLDLQERYSRWFDRMTGYGFTKGIDYTPYQLVHPQNLQTIDDVQMTIDMAKEICMVQRTDKGKEARQYFLKLEKAWNTPELVMARALKLANNKIIELNNIIELQKPQVEFANHVAKSADSIDVGALAKLARDEHIDIGRNRLFEWMREHKMLRHNNEPYQKYIENKWFEVSEIVKSTSYGEKIFLKTLVTGKGQIAIIEMLRREFVDKIAS